MESITNNNLDENQESSVNQEERKTVAEKKDSDPFAFDPVYLPDMLKVYYKRLFPHKAFYRWLSYASCKYDAFHSSSWD